MPHFSGVTGRLPWVGGSKSIPHGPPHAAPTHPHPACRLSETPDVAPTHSSCGVGVSNQAITGASAGDSTLSSSASSSWEGSRFLQGHRRGRGLREGRGPGRSPTAKSWVGAGQALLLPRGLTGLQGTKGRREGRGCSPGLSLHTCSVAEHAGDSADSAPGKPEPASCPASYQCATLVSSLNSLSRLGFPFCEMGLNLPSSVRHLPLSQASPYPSSSLPPPSPQSLPLPTPLPEILCHPTFSAAPESQGLPLHPANPPGGSASLPLQSPQLEKLAS